MRYDFKVRLGRRGGTIAVCEAVESEEAAESLLRFYKSFGLAEARWIREVDVGKVKIVVFPTNIVPVDKPADAEEPAWKTF